ncbi:MAG: hypothetical protein NDI61_04235 [Bdellovibrionaceae bacterium]|nr:hypothetical protein [Pseudobdellovibrionaceae bacterium]
MRSRLALPFFVLLMTFAPNLWAETSPSTSSQSPKPLLCKSETATQHLRSGFALQKDSNTEDALAVYRKCLEIEPDCVDCLYEIGWTHWKLGEWKEVVRVWERALQFNPRHIEIPQYLPSAKQNLAGVEKKIFTQDLKRNTDLFIQSKPLEAPVQMTFVGRWQSYNRNVSHPLDRFDLDIDSPKSVNFSPDGKYVYVNSLEGAKTVVFDATGTEKKAVISHKFTAREASLFSADPPFQYKFPKVPKAINTFVGKPVEGEFTHGGRYFWAPYYRRSWDDLGQFPSALAIIDTAEHVIQRVLHVGPISKYVKVSPDGKWLAVSHWGDNTVGLWDITGKTPVDFKEAGLLVVEKKVPRSKMVGDRDKNCGFCLRGLAFSGDSRYLFVGRMRKGGLAIFDLSTSPHRYLGTVDGLAPGPRDLQVDAKGENLFVSDNSTGFVWRAPLTSLLSSLPTKNSPAAASGKKALHVKVDPKSIGAVSGFAGLGVRSIKISPDGRYVFAAVNQTSEVVAFRASDMSVLARITVDSYPVGLDLSPDGSQMWVTSQGRQSSGGNSVGTFQIRYKNEEVIKKSKAPAPDGPVVPSAAQ